MITFSHSSLFDNSCFYLLQRCIICRDASSIGHSLCTEVILFPATLYLSHGYFQSKLWVKRSMCKKFLPYPEICCERYSLEGMVQKTLKPLNVMLIYFHEKVQGFFSIAVLFSLFCTNYIIIMIKGSAC